MEPTGGTGVALRYEEMSMATRPDEIPPQPDRIDPQSPPETPPGAPPNETPFQEPPEINPEQPDYDRPDSSPPETPPFPSIPVPPD